MLTIMTTIFFVMPFDNVKTYLQKHNLEIVDGVKVEKSGTKRTITSAVKGIYLKSGTMGFFTGWRINFGVHFFNSSFTVCLLEWLENLSKHAYK